MVMIGMVFFMVVNSGSDLLMPVTERRSLSQGLINRLKAPTSLITVVTVWITGW